MIDRRKEGEEEEVADPEKTGVLFVLPGRGWCPVDPPRSAVYF